MRYLIVGELYGLSLIVIIEGIFVGLKLFVKDINEDLKCC